MSPPRGRSGVLAEGGAGAARGGGRRTKGGQHPDGGEGPAAGRAGAFLSPPLHRAGGEGALTRRGPGPPAPAGSVGEGGQCNGSRVALLPGGRSAGTLGLVQGKDEPSPFVTSPPRAGTFSAL